FQLFNEGDIIFRIVEFDTYEGRSPLTFGLFDVFKACDIIFWSQDFGYQQTQSTWTLWEAHDEVMFKTFIQERHLLDLAHPVDVIVSSRDNTDDLLAFDFFFMEF